MCYRGRVRRRHAYLRNSSITHFNQKADEVEVVLSSGFPKVSQY